MELLEERPSLVVRGGLLIISLVFAMLVLKLVLPRLFDTL
jgi:hypothetical protein